MKDKPKSVWSNWPPADQLLNVWGLLVWIPIAALWFVNTWVARMSAVQWLGFYGGALVFAILGASLIFYAKLPLYRQRRFFTFGSRAILEGRRAYYRWGYRTLSFAMVSAAMLIMGRLMHAG